MQIINAQNIVDCFVEWGGDSIMQADTTVEAIYRAPEGKDDRGAQAILEVDREGEVWLVTISAFKLI